jgi:hypothetical protein
VRDVVGAVFDQLEAATDDERALLNTQKEKLDAERLKLVQAHYADAIPLDLLKSEQDRIRTNLDAIAHRLENLATSPTRPSKQRWSASPLVTHRSSTPEHPTPKTLRTLPACPRGRV